VVADGNGDDVLTVVDATTGRKVDMKWDATRGRMVATDAAGQPITDDFGDDSPASQPASQPAAGQPASQPAEAETDDEPRARGRWVYEGGKWVRKRENDAPQADE
jgi:hypothetical protein